MKKQEVFSVEVKKEILKEIKRLNRMKKVPSTWRVESKKTYNRNKKHKNNDRLY